WEISGRKREGRGDTCAAPTELSVIQEGVEVERIRQVVQLVKRDNGGVFRRGDGGRAVELAQIRLKAELNVHGRRFGVRRRAAEATGKRVDVERPVDR